MAETDIMSGIPLGKLRQEREKEKDHLVASQGIELEQDLQTEGGRKLVKLMIEKLSKRIETLVYADPECKAILDVLNDVGTQIELGKAASERLAKRNLRLG